eukprot:Rmarinus@m.8139
MVTLSARTESISKHATYLRRNGFFQEAANHLQSSISEGTPADLQILLEIARCFLLAGDVSSAWDFYRASSIQGADSAPVSEPPALSYGLGVLHEGREQFVQAIQYYRRFLASKESIEEHDGVADETYTTPLLPLDLPGFDVGSSKVPGLSHPMFVAEVRFRLACCFKEIGNHEKAFQFLEELYWDVDGDDDDGCLPPWLPKRHVAFELVEVLRLLNRGEHVEALEAKVGDLQQNPEQCLMMARCAMLLNQHYRATRCLRHVDKLASERTDAEEANLDQASIRAAVVVGRAVMCLRDGDAMQATALTEEARRVAPSSAEAHYICGYAREVLGDISSALRQYEYALNCGIGKTLGSGFFSRVSGTEIEARMASLGRGNALSDPTSSSQRRTSLLGISSEALGLQRTSSAASPRSSFNTSGAGPEAVVPTQAVSSNFLNASNMSHADATADTTADLPPGFAPGPSPCTPSDLWWDTISRPATHDPNASVASSTRGVAAWGTPASSRPASRAHSAAPTMGSEGHVGLGASYDPTENVGNALSRQTGPEVSLIMGPLVVDEQSMSHFELARKLLVRSDDAEFLKKFLKKNELDPRIGDRENGRTLLHVAAGMHRNKCLEMLLRLGVDPSIKDNMRRTPMYEAAKVGGVLAIELLIQFGARADEWGDCGQTPLHVAAGAQDPLTLLSVMAAPGAVEVLCAPTRDARQLKPLECAAEGCDESTQCLTAELLAQADMAARYLSTPHPPLGLGRDIAAAVWTAQEQRLTSEGVRVVTPRVLREALPETFQNWATALLRQSQLGQSAEWLSRAGYLGRTTKADSRFGRASGKALDLVRELEDYCSRADEVYEAGLDARNDYREHNSMEGLSQKHFARVSYDVLEDPQRNLEMRIKYLEQGLSGLQQVLDREREDMQGRLDAALRQARLAEAAAPKPIPAPYGPSEGGSDDDGGVAHVLAAAGMEEGPVGDSASGTTDRRQIVPGVFGLVRGKEFEISGPSLETPRPLSASATASRPSTRGRPGTSDTFKSKQKQAAWSLGMAAMFNGGEPDPNMKHAITAVARRIADLQKALVKSQEDIQAQRALTAEHEWYVRDLERRLQAKDDYVAELERKCDELREGSAAITAVANAEDSELDLKPVRESDVLPASVASEASTSKTGATGARRQTHLSSTGSRRAASGSKEDLRVAFDVSVRAVERLRAQLEEASHVRAALVRSLVRTAARLHTAGFNIPDGIDIDWNDHSLKGLLDIEAHSLCEEQEASDTTLRAAHSLDRPKSGASSSVLGSIGLGSLADVAAAAQASKDPDGAPADPALSATPGPSSAPSAACSVMGFMSLADVVSVAATSEPGNLGEPQDAPSTGEVIAPKSARTAQVQSPGIGLADLTKVLQEAQAAATEAEAEATIAVAAGDSLPEVQRPGSALSEASKPPEDAVSEKMVMSTVVSSLRESLMADAAAPEASTTAAPVSTGASKEELNASERTAAGTAG